jgi:hypothetical protein
VSKSNIIIQGDVNTGKSRSLITLLPEYEDEKGKLHKGAGQKVALIGIEANAEVALGRNLCSHRPGGIHYHYIPTVAITWDQFRNWMSILNKMPIEKALEVQDPNRGKCHQLLDVIDTCREFTCDLCGEVIGDLNELNESWTAALDGLTGLTTISKHLCVGMKPILSRPDYNPVMSTVENFLDLWWGASTCNTVILSHVDREVSPITGATSITLHTIGQKLAPRLVKKPDEIITATYDEGNYFWHTELPGQITKVRRLPRGVDLVPDFSRYNLFTKEPADATA